MVRNLQINGSFLGQKSALLLLLVLALVFSEGCSRKMPCPDVNKATAKAAKKASKKNKGNKVVKTKAVAADGEEGADNAMASAAVSEEATESTVKKPNLSGAKNKYNKNGLLQKKKYKKLRNNAGKKTSRNKGNFFSRLFSGGSKTKTKTKRKPNVEPVAE